MEKVLYSLKMRAAQGGPHEKGGRHISGSERIIEKGAVNDEVLAMLERAKNHQRGEADFISIKVAATTTNSEVISKSISFISFK